MGSKQSTLNTIFRSKSKIFEKNEKPNKSRDNTKNPQTDMTAQIKIVYE